MASTRASTPASRPTHVAGASTSRPTARLRSSSRSPSAPRSRLPTPRTRRLPVQIEASVHASSWDEPGTWTEGVARGRADRRRGGGRTDRAQACAPRVRTWPVGGAPGLLRHPLLPLPVASRLVPLPAGIPPPPPTPTPAQTPTPPTPRTPTPRAPVAAAATPADARGVVDLLGHAG